MVTKLLRFWEKAASDLGLQITVSFSLVLDSGCELNSIFLIREFGATKGMLVFGDYEEIAPFVDEIVEAGYGYSILDEPLEDEEYKIGDYIDLLKDWGWSGHLKTKPSWLNQ